MASPPPAIGTPPAPPAPGESGYIPLLPKGKPMFEGIPVEAVVLEALGPAVKDGAVIVRAQGQLGVALILGGSAFEAYAFNGVQTLTGKAALDAIKQFNGGLVAAYQFTDVVVETLPTLLRGEFIYSDLRLKWVDWQSFVDDLRGRAGNFSIELITPTGSGTVCVRDGSPVAVFTTAHPELGDPSLFAELIAAKQGLIYARREPRPLDPMHLSAGDAPSFAAPPPTPVESMFTAPTPLPVDSPFDAPTPPAPAPQFSAPAPGAPPSFVPPMGAQDPSTDPDLVTIDDYQEPPMAPPTGPPVFPANGNGGHAAFADPMASIFAPPPTAPPPSMSQPQAIAVPMAAVVDQLKAIARQRLQRSSSRVEMMLDDGARKNTPVEVVLAEIRGITIRGVMQSTIDSLVDEMMASASAVA